MPVGGRPSAGRVDLKLRSPLSLSVYVLPSLPSPASGATKACATSRCRRDQANSEGRFEPAHVAWYVAATKSNTFLPCFFAVCATVIMRAAK